MKAKRAHKPVRKCPDCSLNLGAHCGVYSVPREMWHPCSCPGYKNEEMFSQYEAQQAKHPSTSLRKTK